MKYYYLLAQFVDPSNLPETPADRTTVQIILNVVFGLIGAISVLVVILAGIRFMLAQGDPGKVAQARNTILFALIGVAVSIFAFAIVGFIVARTGS